MNQQINDDQKRMQAINANLDKSPMEDRKSPVSDNHIRKIAREEAKKLIRESWNCYYRKRKEAIQEGKWVVAWECCLLELCAENTVCENDDSDTELDSNRK